MRLVDYFGGLCKTSISSVATMYYSLSLRRLVGLPILILVVVNLITSQTLCLVKFTYSMMSHRCFREVHLSGGKITLRFQNIVGFGTQNVSRSS